MPPGWRHEAGVLHVSQATQAFDFLGSAHAHKEQLNDNLSYGQFSKFHVCFSGLDPGNLKLQYGQISNIFAFRISDAQFEVLRFEIMKTCRSSSVDVARTREMHVFLPHSAGGTEWGGVSRCTLNYLVFSGSGLWVVQGLRVLGVRVLGFQGFTIRPNGKGSSPR